MTQITLVKGTLLVVDWMQKGVFRLYSEHYIFDNRPAMFKTTIFLLSFLVLSTTLHADIKVTYATQETLTLNLKSPMQVPPSGQLVVASHS